MNMERDVWSMALKLASKRDCRMIFDVGAHKGNTTRRFLNRFPKAFVYSFEPDLHTFPALAKRHAGEARCRILNMALGASPGQTRFYRGAASFTSSLYPRNVTGRRYYRSDHVMVDTIDVTVETLDRVCEKFDIGQIDLLKLDTQGGEFDILKGARRLLSRGLIEILVTEFFIIPHYEGAPLLDEIWTLLRGHGYELFDLFVGAYGANGQARYGDAIFVSPQFRTAVLDVAVPEA